jgi:hypothetical protein
MTPEIQSAFLSEMESLFAEFYEGFCEWIKSGETESTTFGDSWNSPSSAEFIEISGIEVKKSDAPHLEFTLSYSKTSENKYLLSVDLLGSGSTKVKVYHVMVIVFPDGTIACTEKYQVTHILLRRW